MDIIIHCLMGILKKHKYSYLDIGANDPQILGNTYLMYKFGNFGNVDTLCVKLYVKKYSSIWKGTKRPILCTVCLFPGCVLNLYVRYSFFKPKKRFFLHRRKIDAFDFTEEKLRGGINGLQKSFFFSKL